MTATASGDSQKSDGLKVRIGDTLHTVEALEEFNTMCQNVKTAEALDLVVQYVQLIVTKDDDVLFKFRGSADFPCWSFGYALLDTVLQVSASAQRRPDAAPKGKLLGSLATWAYTGKSKGHGKGKGSDFAADDDDE